MIIRLDGGGSACAPLSSRVPVEQEIAMLVALRRRVNARIDELIGSPPSFQIEEVPVSTARVLPVSDLVECVPGLFLFKGGPRHEG